MASSYRVLVMNVRLSPPEAPVIFSTTCRVPSLPRVIVTSSVIPASAARAAGAAVNVRAVAARAANVSLIPVMAGNRSG